MSGWAQALGAAVVFALVASASSARGQEFQDVRLPSHVTIISPGANVSPELATFGGSWKGRWGGVLSSIFVVERITPSGEANVIYAWGANPSRTVRPGSVEARAAIRNGILVFGNNPRFEFTRSFDGSLAGKRFFNGIQDGWVVMTRVTLSRADFLVAEDVQSTCELEPSTFTLSEGNRLDDQNLSRILTGKRINVVRRYKSGSDYIHGIREFRPDGSVVFTCETGTWVRGPWSPCRGIGTNRFRLEGSREIGVWSISRNIVCLRGSRAESPSCFAINRQGTEYYVSRVSGTPSCVEGPISIE